MKSIAGIITSVAKTLNPESPSPIPNSFSKGIFPTKMRYLYLRSKYNQNNVVSIGYYWETPTIVCYQVAKCRNDSPSMYQKRFDLNVVKDIFSKKIGRAIVNGRMLKEGPMKINCISKEQLYNKFIFAWHPDKDARRNAKKELFKETFQEVHTNIDLRGLPKVNYKDKETSVIWLDEDSDSNLSSKRI